MSVKGLVADLYPSFLQRISFSLSSLVIAGYGSASRLDCQDAGRPFPSTTSNSAVSRYVSNRRRHGHTIRKAAKHRMGVQAPGRPITTQMTIRSQFPRRLLLVVYFFSAGVIKPCYFSPASRHAHSALTPSGQNHQCTGGLFS